MKKLSLLILLLLTGVSNYAQQILVQGTVQNTASMPVANAIVYVTDTGNSVPGFTYIDTTNTSGQYIIATTGGFSTGTPLLVRTASCGIMLTQYYVYQGSPITANFTICTTPPAGGQDTVHGKVSLGTSSTGAFPAKVYLIEVDSQPSVGKTLTAIDSTNTDQLGNYQFIYQLNNSNPVLTKAALSPAHPSFAAYMPTYHDSSLVWNGALNVNGKNVTANIYLEAGVNPGGPGFIGGQVLQGANKTTGVGDPLNQRMIILTTASGQGVAYTYSDASGAFGFSNLAYGTYKLSGDAWGKLNPALVVTIDAMKPSINNILFEENSTDFTGSIVTAINHIAISSVLKVYPNPVTDQLIITGLGNIDGVKTITVAALTGAVVYNTTATTDEIRIPAAELANGIYLLNVQTAEGTAVYKIIK